jgi:glycosyltransferase involved in cell wall biosynthesis
MKALLLIPGEQSQADRSRDLQAEREGRCPRWSLFETAFDAERLDFKALRSAPAHRRIAYRFLPKMLGLAYEAYKVRKHYDVVVTWSEMLALWFAILQKLPGRHVPQLAMLYWMSKPGVDLAIRILRSSIDRIVTWSSVQHRILTTQLAYPADRVDLIKHFVDERFWQPQPAFAPAGEPVICSAGAEMRDFDSLIEAVRDLPLRCVIAARELRLKKGMRKRSLADVAAALPASVEVKAHSAEELRALYARSRFVVVPLLPSDTDNGITVILEAMAMGKAVICTRTEGQVDAIEDGVTGIYVDGNPLALRAAILDLWDNPEKAERIGRAARAYIESSTHRLDLFVAAVKASAERAATVEA